MNFVFQESSNQFELRKGQERRITYDQEPIKFDGLLPTTHKGS